MSDYLRSALGYLNGGTGDNEYVGQTLDINNVKLRVTRLIAEGESIVSPGCGMDLATVRSHLGEHHLSAIRSPTRSTAVRLRREKKDDARGAERGEEKGCQTLPILRDICPPVMCQTCVLTRGQTAPSTRIIYSDIIISFSLYRVRFTGWDFQRCPLVDDSSSVFSNDRLS